jgi:UMF1 family MFS transporter
MDAPPTSTRAQRIAWVLYDWGNSGFGMIGIGVVFSNAFISTLAPIHTRADGSTLRAVTLLGQVIPADGFFAVLTALSAVLIVLTAPLLGAIADVKGWGKSMLVVSATLGAAIAMSMGFIGPGDWILGSVLYIASNVMFMTSLTFYNAFLPRLVPPEHHGRLSGDGFAAGYIGGGVATILAVFVVMQHFSLGGALFFGGVWWLVFALPAFILLPGSAPSSAPRVAKSLVLEGISRLHLTFANIRAYRMLFMFLLAFLIYSNGIDTVINIAPAYTTQVFQVADEKVTALFLGIQFVAFFGAVVCGRLSDRFGHKRIIMGTLAVWCILSMTTPFLPGFGAFVVVAAGLGLVLGGVQSSSRALMAQLTPAHLRNEAFGFFSLAGRAVSIFGPLIYALVATTVDSRWGVMAVIPFLVTGLVVLALFVKPKAEG